MSFLDRAKAAAEQVRAKAQEGVEEVQARKELAQAYWDLGHKAHELASSGAISHPELDPLVQRITELLGEENPGGGASPGSATGSSGPGPTGASAEPTMEPEQATGTTPPETPA